MSHSAALAGQERQPRLGSVERLDLRFLVDRQHHGAGWRVHAETNDVLLDLFGVGEILRPNESVNTGKLEAVRFPDALNRAQHEPGWRVHVIISEFTEVRERCEVQHRESIVIKLVIEDPNGQCVSQ